MLTSQSQNVQIPGPGLGSSQWKYAMIAHQHNLNRERKLTSSVLINFSFALKPSYKSISLTYISQGEFPLERIPPLVGLGTCP